jgi:L-fuculose-phosphate aldolase
MTPEEGHLRAEIVATCRALADRGLTQGTSGNVSARLGATMLISPSATPYAAMTPEMVAAMPLSDASGQWHGPRRPSTEWPMHRDLYRARPDIHALVHCHSREATALSITRSAIPACHYMIAAFGGSTIRCADYATFGTDDLSSAVVVAMENRLGCLMANHGQITAGATLSRALTLAVELEELAALYRISRDLPGFTILDDAEITRVIAKFRDYLAP